MKKLLFTWLLLPAICFARDGKQVRGEIYNFKSEDKVAGATVSSGTANVISSADGSFVIELNDSIYVTAIGYEKKAILLKAGQTFVSIALKPTDANLQDVVVSGTLRTITKMASPIPVETYSAKFFRKNPTPNIFEALSIVNGVQPQLNCNVCNTGDIHINGMDGPYTMVLIDGMPIVSSLSTVYGLSGIPNSMVKRIEIVKGPASTLYGSEAVGGLINIITKDPLSSGRFSLDANFSSLSEFSADFSMKVTMKKASSLIGINLFNYWTRHDVNEDRFTDVTQQRRISIFNKWDFERKNSLPASFAIRVLGEDRWGGERNWTRAWRGSDSIYGESIDTRRFELIGRYGLSKSLMSEYSYNYHFQDSYYGTTKYHALQHTAFAQLRWDKTIGRHNILAGIPVKFIWYDDNTVATGTPVKNKPSAQTITAVFIQDEIKFNSHVSTLAGLRYERSDIQGGVLAPRLAIKWQAGRKQTIRLSSGNGFRVVNLFTEDHAALSGARDIVIKNDLKPEKSWNGNLNYTGEIRSSNGFIGVDASLFYTYFTNKIVPDYLTDPLKIIYDNLKGYAVSAGLSANCDIVIRNGMKIIGGFTWMDVYSIEDDANGKSQRQQQMFAPKFSANYALSYPIRRWAITFDLTGKLYGPMRLPIVPNDFRPEFSPWFMIMNLQVGKKLGSRWEIYTSIKNILNFIPKDPILRPTDPFNKRVNDPLDNPNGYNFDPNYSYAPMQGIKAELGLRYEVK